MRPTPKAQGALEYLLLIAGVILVAATVLFFILQSYVPTAGTILEDNLNQFPTGNFPDPNSGTLGFGPIDIDWTTLPIVNAHDYNGQNAPVLQNFRLINTDTVPHTLKGVQVNWDWVNLPSVTSDDFNLVSLRFQDPSSMWHAADFPFGPVDAGTPLTFPGAGITLGPGESWIGEMVFDTQVSTASGYQTFSLYAYDSGNIFLPIHSHARVQLNFSDDALQPLAASETLHVYSLQETQGPSQTKVCATLPSVNYNESVFSTVTDAWDADNSNYALDFAYSSAYGFPTRIPNNAQIVSADAFLFQQGPITSGGGAITDADPLRFIRDATPAACSTVDNLPESGIQGPNASNPSLDLTPFPSPSADAELKSFPLYLASTPFLQPGDNALFYTLVGSNFGESAAPDQAGNRAWYSAYSPSAQPPILVIRYQTP